MRDRPTLVADSHRGLYLGNAHFSYPHANVLTDASLELQKGGSCIISGANGSGKSTLLYILAGLVPLDQGTITIGGFLPDPRRPSSLTRRGVRRGFVFQEGGLLSNMNALANVALPLRYHADLYGLTIADVEKRARAALERVRITQSEMYELPAHLSFGVRKRVALARAMAIEPKFFYFDDPDVGLDARTGGLVHEILCEYRDDPEVTMLVATNREALVERLGVPSYVLLNGRLIERQSTPATSGPPPRVA
jgi:phospholipid/cholesterol/gamma-HCH transport system ATP-binding protein